MPILVNVTGGPQEIECRQFKSFSEAVKILRAGLAAIAADDNGSISIWRREDTKVVRAGFYRHYATLDERDCRSLKLLRAWLKVWYPKMLEQKGDTR